MAVVFRCGLSNEKVVIVNIWITIKTSQNKKKKRFHSYVLWVLFISFHVWWQRPTIPPHPPQYGEKEISSSRCRKIEIKKKKRIQQQVGYVWPQKLENVLMVLQRCAFFSLACFIRKIYGHQEQQKKKNCFPFFPFHIRLFTLFRFYHHLVMVTIFFSSFFLFLFWSPNSI